MIYHSVFEGIENSFSLQGSDIKSRGKALGIPLKDNWWICVHFLMHGHIVAITSRELQSLERAREEYLASGGPRAKGRKHVHTLIHTPSFTYTPHPSQEKTQGS